MQRSSIENSLLSELLGMAQALGGLKEALRQSERSHDKLESRVRNLEVALLERPNPHIAAESASPWWKQLLQVLLPHETLTKLLLSLVPRLLFIGAVLGKWLEKAAAWLLQSFS